MLKKINARFVAARFKPISGLCLAIALSCSAASANAQDESGRFKLYVGGIPAGELVFNAKNNGTSYQVAGAVGSTGLIGSLVKVSYKAQSSGAVQSGHLVPQSYSEKADTGRRQQSSEMTYKGGVPVSTQVEPPRKPRDYDVDPSSQKGTFDPLTMIYTTLRDIDQADACKLNQRMFDGRRLSEVVLNAPKIDGDTITCGGVYRRLAGFSAKDMKERTEFPFSFRYKSAGNGRFRVDRISSASLFGKVVIKRK